MSESKFYSLAPLDKAGNPYEFSQLKGKVVLIVNVASKGGSIVKFVRYEVGEGIEKKTQSFEDEVRDQLK